MSSHLDPGLQPRKQVNLALQAGKPVSYTHLDVYKRQPSHRLNRNRPGSVHCFRGDCALMQELSLSTGKRAVHSAFPRWFPFYAGESALHIFMQVGIPRSFLGKF